MSHSTTVVIRRDDTVLEDPFLLQIGQCEQLPQLNQAPAMTAPQACILENTGEYVVLEVTCACGRKSHVKCEYATSEP
jgi:hypothetical protein